MKNREITLTPQELEDLKDEIKFREKVVFQLKQLTGVPEKITRLEVFSYVQWILIMFILGLMAWGANGVK